jgi:Zn-dependent oligopeptidase
MTKNITQLDLAEAYSQNTIWDSLFRLDFSNTDAWRAEFSNFVSFLQADLDDILAKPASWKSTYLRFKKIVSVCKYISVYCYTHPDIHPKQERDVGSLLGDVQRQINKFINQCWVNPKLIAKFKSLGDRKLTEEKRKIYDSWVENFFKEEQDVETKKNYTKLTNKLQDHITQFMENNDALNNSRRNTIFVPKENASILEGIKKDVLKEAARRAREAKKKGWLFLITESTTYKIIRECKDRDFRHRVYKKYHKINQVGDFTFKNGEVLKDILFEKHKIAQLMGKDNYAELVISNYMINTPKDAYQYLDNIEAKLLPTVKKLEKEMKELAKADKVRELKAWDVIYYFQRLNMKYNLYVNKFEDYFIFEDVLPKMLAFFEQKFDLKITKENFNGAGQKDVHCYRIHDNRTERHGFFFLSPYNNPSKGNCYQLDLLKSDTVDKGVVLPSIQLIDLLINKGKGHTPRSKMSFYDVFVTLHEFGHAFHSFFEPINDHVSKNLKMSWDLVEMPSQFLEHFIYDYELMKSFSSHFETGEPMTEEFFLKVVQNEQYFEAYHTYCNIQTYKAQLWVYENFKPYSAKNLQKLVEAKLAPKGIIYNIAKDDYMTYSDHMLDYGPSGYIYLYSAQLAYQLYKKKPEDLRKVFTKTFNTDQQVDLREHMKKNFDLNEVDILSFITKGLPIEIYA